MVNDVVDDSFAAVFFYLFMKLSPLNVEVFVVIRVSFISPFSLLLIQSTAGLLWSVTAKFNVLFIVCFDTVVITVYSVWFPKCCHVMVGKGNP